MPASDLLPSFYSRCFTTTFPSCKSLNPCSICWLILDLKVFCLVWGVILPLLHRCPESCLLSGSRWPRPFRVYGICPRCPILLPCLVPLCSESKACMPSDLAPRALAVSAYGQDFMLFFSGLRTGSSETMPASWLAVHRSQTFLVLLAYSCLACRLNSNTRKTSSAIVASLSCAFISLRLLLRSWPFFLLRVFGQLESFFWFGVYSKFLVQHVISFACTLIVLWFFG